MKHACILARRPQNVRQRRGYHLTSEKTDVKRNFRAVREMGEID